MIKRILRRESFDSVYPPRNFRVEKFGAKVGTVTEDNEGGKKKKKRVIKRTSTSLENLEHG